MPAEAKESEASHDETVKIKLYKKGELICRPLTDDEALSDKKPGDILIRNGDFNHPEVLGAGFWAHVPSNFDGGKWYRPVGGETSHE